MFSFNTIEHHTEMLWRPKKRSYRASLKVEEEQGKRQFLTEWTTKWCRKNPSSRKRKKVEAPVASHRDNAILKEEYFLETPVRLKVKIGDTNYSGIRKIWKQSKDWWHKELYMCDFLIYILNIFNLSFDFFYNLMFSWKM